MTEDRLPVPPAKRTARGIARNTILSGPALRLLDDEVNPGVYLARLVENALEVDALRFMAHTLSGPELVWWVCLCVRHTAAESMPGEQGTALQAAVAWVLNPSTENRQGAARAVAAAGADTPAGCAARVASMSDGHSPVRASKVASGGVFLAAAQGPPADWALNYRQFVALGIDVDQGTASWKTG